MFVTIIDQAYQDILENLRREENLEKLYGGDLRKKYVGVIIDDLKEIMTYTDSSQFVNRKLKKGDNIRIAEPK